MKKRTLCLLMALTMLLLISVCCVSANAAATVSYIYIENMRQPLAGSTPDYNINFDTGNLATATGVNGDAINGIIWYELQYKTGSSNPIEKKMDKNDKFELSKQYRARIFVAPAGNAVFANSVTARAYGLTTDAGIGYKNASVVTPTGNTNSQYKVVVVDYICSFEAITEVKITGLKLPKAGETPDDDCNVLTEGVNVSGEIVWTRKTGTYGYEAMGENEVFVAGETYKFALWLRAEYTEDFWFATDSLGENVAKVTVNGITLSDDNICDTWEVDYVRGVECTYYVPFTTIRNIDVAGVSAPVAGETPDYEVSPTTSGYDITTVYWLDETLKAQLLEEGVEYMEALNDAKVGKSEVFEAGHEYAIYITVTPHQNYEIDYDPADEDVLDFAATVNGNDAYEYSGRKGDNASFSYNFGVARKQTIFNINITGIDAPKPGELPDYTAVCGADSYEVKSIFWIDETLKAQLIEEGMAYVNAVNQAKLIEGDGQTFKAGHAYKVCLGVAPCKNYEIDYYGDELYYNATVNGIDADESSAYRGDNASFDYTFDTLNYFGISSVTATGFDVPVAGNTVDVLGSVSGTGIQFKNCYWYDLTAGKKLANDAKFESGHKYRLIITVTAKENYRFAVNDSGYPDATKLTVTINGNTATVASSLGSATSMTFRCDYEHTCKFTLVKSKAATCSEQGKNAYYKCSCGTFAEDAAGTQLIADIESWGNIAVNANNHSYKDVVTPATLTAAGKIENKCSACDTVKSTTTINAVDTVKIPYVSYTYRASVITPTVTVKDTAGNVLTKDTDYTVSYSSGRRNVGTYDVTVTFKGNYSGSKTLSFKITPMDISKCTVKLSATSYTYKAAVITPDVTITNPNGAKLTKDTHYTVSYSSGRRNVGTYDVTVTLKGNYKGTKTLSFKIVPMDISKCTVKLSATSYTYKAAVITPDVTITNPNGAKLTKDTHYTVSYSSGRRNVGTYNVTVTLKGNYTGTKTLSFKIVPMDISKCTVKLSYVSYTYNGSVKTPAVTVTNSNGAKLTKDTHYTVSYASGRKNVGTYNVTVTLKGNYTGTKTLTFKINPPKTTVASLTAGTKSITVNLNKQTTQTTGYQIQYSTNKDFTDAKTKTLTSNSTVKTTLSSLTSGKTYYVRVRTYKTVNDVKYYSGWSEYKYVKVK